MRSGILIFTTLLLLPVATWADIGPGPHPRPPGPPATGPGSQPATQAASANGMPLGLVVGGALASTVLVAAGLLLAGRKRGH